MGDEGACGESCERGDHREQSLWEMAGNGEQSVRERGMGRSLCNRGGHGELTQWGPWGAVCARDGHGKKSV